MLAKMERTFALLGVALAAAVFGVGCRPLSAQAAKQQEIARRVPVTVALTNQMPYRDAPAVILRRATAVPHDVILLRRNGASGAQLSAAVFQLLVLRERDGDTASTDGVYRVIAPQGPAAWRGSEERTAGRTVSRLFSAPAREISGVGIVAATELYLPSRQMLQQRVRLGQSGK